MALAGLRLRTDVLLSHRWQPVVVMSREMRYIIGRVIAGLLIGIGMFYFRSAHAASATHEALWYKSQVAENQNYYRNTNFPNGDPLGNRPISAQLHATGVNATATGPIINGNRSLTPTQTGRAVKIGEAVLVGASAARFIARAYPALLIASTLYDAYKLQGVNVNPTTGEITKTGPARATWYIHAIGSYANRCPTTCTVNQTFTSNQDIFGACFSTCAAGSELRNKPAPFTGTDASITTLYPKADLCTVGGGCYGEAGIILYKTGQTVPGTTAPATDAELDQAWRAGNGDLQKDFVERAVAADASVDLSNETTQVTGSLVSETPHSVSTTTVTNADGTTSTKRKEDYQTVTLAVQGDKLSTQTITANVTNNSVTTINGTVVESNVTTPAPAPTAPVVEDSDPPPTFTDTAFPAIPPLYVQKYQNGLVGVWNDKKPQLMNSAFMQSVTASLPTFASGGECPVWAINLNFGQYANFGTQALKVPCFVWNAIALIFLITASFSARRIIFGG